jgi:hypothetical protein
MMHLGPRGTLGDGSGQQPAETGQKLQQGPIAAVLQRHCSLGPSVSIVSVLADASVPTRGSTTIPTATTTTATTTTTDTAATTDVVVAAAAAALPTALGDAIVALARVRICSSTQGGNVCGLNGLDIIYDGNGKAVDSREGCHWSHACSRQARRRVNQ